MSSIQVSFATEREARILAATAQAWRHELAKARALNVQYRDLLERAGIDPPADPSGEEALRRFRLVFETAGLADPGQHPELLADWERR